MGKILIALSGGVDSSVAALLLKQQGHALGAVYMRTWMDEGRHVFNCPWEEDIRYARTAAETIGVPFQVLNFMEHYREHVVRYLLEGYESGLTPNPDIQCNREIKFGLLAQYAFDHGYSHIATGHYCQLATNGDGSVDLFEGGDKNKDQSYFLCRLSQEQLRRACFPIGHLQKAQVRALAKEYGLPNAARKDSQGICFLGKVPIADFLRSYIQDKPGPIVTRDGRVLGEHRGLHYFTLGQRKGIGVPSNADFENYVVVEKRRVDNALVVAFASDSQNGLQTRVVLLDAMSYTHTVLPDEMDLLAKPRYRDPSQKIHFSRISPTEARVTFEQEQRALAPGQVLALYDGERVVGSGVYTRAES